MIGRKPTTLKYLADSYLFECEATILDIQIMNDKEQQMLILDDTIFYPQGGGQPYDTGLIRTSSSIFQVQEVRSVDGVVHHIGTFMEGSMKTGDEVKLIIDKERRLNHCRIHSAGELICGAMHNIGYGDWKVVSAIHYPDQSSVEYGGIIPAEHREKFRHRLEQEVNHLVCQGEDVRIQVVNNRDDAKTLCGFVPDYIPEGQPIRVVTVSGEIGRPCMGTHVKNIREIGAVRIRKVKSKKGKTTISYVLV